MTEDLEKTLRRVREALAADPAGLVVGDLPKGNPAVEIPEGPLGAYYEFLAVCDGARCGIVDLWSFGELAGQQFRIDLPCVDTLDWLCVGQVLYEPLALHRATGTVSIFPRDPASGIDRNDLGSFIRFLSVYVFGPGYLRLVPDAKTDEWCELLAKLKLIE